ncbi:MAG: PEP-CTERM sorting domain-containing protein [Candidatus Omnitrophota bacterium]
MKIFKVILMIAVFGVFSSQASANLLSDPGFENGGTAIAIKDGPWTWSGGSNGDAFYDATVSMNGAKAAKVVAWGGNLTDYAYFNEDFTGIDFSSPYLLNGNFLWNSAETLKNGSTVKLQVKWFNSLGSVIRTDESAIFDNSYASDTWHPLDITTAAAPAGTVKVSAVVALNANGAYTPNSAVWVDDMSFQAVPEPASMLLLGSGLVGLLGFGRRKRS